MSDLSFSFRGKTLPITCSEAVTKEQAQMAVQSSMFQEWCRRCEHVKGSESLELKGVEIQSVDLFGARGVGFVKIKADVRLIRDGVELDHPLPGICFLRGDAVAIFVILYCEDEAYSLLVKQPRIPIGRVQALEIPAGMLDSESQTVAGTAVQEIKEECGIEIRSNELVDLTALACQEARHEGYLPLPALPMSPGGCDESCRFFLLEKRVTRSELNDMKGRLEGLPGEYIQLQVVPMARVWEISGDAKAMICMFLIERLRKQGRLPAPGVLATPLRPLPNPMIKGNIPQLAFGLYKIPAGDQGERIILEAIQQGYRHFDGASFYKNESTFGKAWRKSGVSRNELFVTTKVWNDALKQGRTGVRASVEQSLVDADCEYFDLCLIHWPVPGYFCEAYRELETLYDEGKLRALGVSNFDQNEYQELLESGIRVPVVCNQIEVSPVMYRKEMIDYFEDKKIAIAAYKPLQRGAALKNPTITSLSSKYGVSAAQIMIRWAVHKGFIVATKSSSAIRMMENRNVFFFELSTEDMMRLDGLTSDRDLREREEHEKMRKTTM